MQLFRHVRERSVRIRSEQFSHFRVIGGTALGLFLSRRSRTRSGIDVLMFITPALEHMAIPLDKAALVGFVGKTMLGTTRTIMHLWLVLQLLLMVIGGSHEGRVEIIGSRVLEMHRRLHDQVFSRHLGRRHLHRMLVLVRMLPLCRVWVVAMGHNAAVDARRRL